MKPTKKKVVKGWCIPPLNQVVSRDGWTYYLPIFLTKREALGHASEELVVPCEISYQLPEKAMDSGDQEEMQECLENLQGLEG